MTTMLEIITKYCAVYVDDIRLQELSTANQALYARRMSNYFIPAISLFTIPTEMIEFLNGTAENPKLVLPKVASVSYTTEKDETANFTIELGEEYIGYELFNASIKTFDKFGNAYVTPIEIATYDAETGIITIEVMTGETVKSGTIFEFDFYSDGYFVNTLTAQMQNILGICFQIVWQDRFNSDWLSNVSKVEDKSFSEQNRANKMRADTERLDSLRRKLAGEMRRFEQNAYYNQTIPSGNRLKI